MDNAIWGMLNDVEKALLREAEPEALAGLDEDALSELHDRVRRARNKYSKLYRRRAAAEVAGAGARSKGHARHARTLIKAEAFEEALRRVSKALAREAKRSARALRDERLALAAAGKGGKAGKAGKGSGKVGEGRKPAKAKTPASKKKSASTKAATKRKQAARDKR